ncbi:beta strand repeat-containing protein, partial [Termitidicoccus mucosus]
MNLRTIQHHRRAAAAFAFHRHAAAATAAAFVFLLLAGGARAQNSSWSGSGAGDWGDAANWNPAGAPNAPGANVTVVSTGLVGDRTVTVNVTATLGSLTVNGTDAAYHTTTFAPDGAGSLNFFSTGGPSLINFHGSNRVIINSIVNLGNDLRITAVQDTASYLSTLTLAGAVNLGAGTLSIVGVEPNSTVTISGSVSGTGGIAKSGAGLFYLTNINNTFTGGLALTGGTMAATVRNAAAAGIVIGAVSADNNNLGAGDVTVGGGAVLNINSSGAGAGQFVGLQAGALTVADGGLVRLTENDYRNQFAFRMTGGTLAGGGATSGTLLLERADFNYAGGVITGAPDLVFSTGAAASANNSISVTLNGAAMDGYLGTVQKTGHNALAFTDSGTFRAGELIITSGSGTISLGQATLDLLAGLTYSGTNAPFTNLLTVTNLTQLGLTNQLGASALNLNANAVSNIYLNGHDQTFAAINLAGDARLGLWFNGSTPATLTIGGLAASAAAANSLGQNYLSIYNWTGNPASHPGDGLIAANGNIVKSTGGADLSKIWFRGYAPGAVDIGGGVLAPSDFLTTTLINPGNWFDFATWDVDVPNGAGSKVIIDANAVVSGRFNNLQGQTVTIGHLQSNRATGGLHPSLFVRIQNGTLVFDSGVSGTGSFGRAASIISGPGSVIFDSGAVLNNDLVINTTGAAMQQYQYRSAGVIFGGLNSAANVEVNGSGMALVDAPLFTGTINVNSTLGIGTGSGTSTFTHNGVVVMNQGSVLTNHGYGGADTATFNGRFAIAGDFSMSSVYVNNAGDVALDADRRVNVLAYYTGATSGFLEGTNLVGSGGLMVNTNTSHFYMHSGSNLFSGGLVKTGLGSITASLHSDLVIGELAPGNNYLGSGSITIDGGFVQVNNNGHAIHVRGLLTNNSTFIGGFASSGAGATTFSGTVRAENGSSLTFNGGALTITEDAVWTAGINGMALSANRDVTINTPFQVGYVNLGVSPDTGITQTISSTMAGGITGLGTVAKSGAGTTRLNTIANMDILSVGNGVFEITGDNFIRPRLGPDQPTLIMSGGLLQLDTGTNRFHNLRMEGNAGFLLLNHSALWFNGDGTGGTWSGTAFQLSLANDSGVWTKSDGVTDYYDTFVYFTSTMAFGGGNAWRLGNIAFTGYEQGATFGQTSISGTNVYFLAPTGDPLSEWAGARGTGVDTDRLWSNGGNWINGVPNAVGRIAAVRDLDGLLNNNTIVVDANATIGKLYLESAGAQIFTIGNGGGLLTFNNSGSHALLSNQGLHTGTLSASLKLDSDLEIRQNSANLLYLTSHVTGSGGIIYNTSGTTVLGTANASGTSTSDFTGGFLLVGSTAASIDGAGVGAGQRAIWLGANGSVFGSGSYNGTDAAGSIQSLTIGDGTPGMWYAIAPGDANGDRTSVIDASLRIAGNLFVGRRDVGGGSVPTVTFQSSAPGYVAPGQWSLAGYSVNGVSTTSTINFNQDLEGPGGLVLASGILTVALNGDNSFAGGVTVWAQPTLNIGSDTALGTGTLTVYGGVVAAAGGARSIKNEVAINGGFTVSGTLTLAHSGTSTTALGGNGYITIGNLLVLAASNTLSGTGRLGLIGGGTMRLEGANTYTGNTSIGNGSGNNSDQWRFNLQVADDRAIGSGTLIFNGNARTATLASHGGPITIRNAVQFANYNMGLDGSAGLLTLDPAAGATLYMNTTITVAGTAAFGGNLSLSGTYGITKTGAGTLILNSGNSSYTGTTSLFQGTLVANAGGGNITLGKYVAGESYLGAGDFTFGSNYSVRVLELISTGSVVFADNLGLVGNDAVNTASINVTEQSGAVSGNSVVAYLNPDVSSTISGNATGYLRTPGDLVKNGGGNVTLTGGNLVAGGTFRVQSGTLTLGGGNITTANLQVEGGVLGLDANTTLNNLGRLTLGGGTLALNGHTLTSTLLNVTGTTTVDFTGGLGTLVLANITGDWAGGFLNVTNWDGNPTVGGGVTQFRFTQNAGQTFTSAQLRGIKFANKNSAIAYVAGARVVRLVTDQYELVPLGVGAEWDGGAGNVLWETAAGANWEPDGTPNGPGLVAVFRNLDPALNGKTINATGVVQLGGLVFDSSAANYSFTGAEFQLVNDTLYAANPVYIQMSDANSVQIGNVLKLHSDLTIGHYGTGTLTFDAQITDEGRSLAITKDGPGKVVFNTNNAFTDGFTLLDGTVVANNDLALGTGRVNLNGGTLDSGASNRNLANAFTLNGTVATTGSALTLSSAAGNTLIGASRLVNSNRVTISGTLGGAGSLAKSGAGTLLLAAANTYTGTTTLSSGTLLGGTANIIATSAALVNNSVFALGGFDQLVNNLTGSGTTLLGANTLTVRESADTTYAGLLAGAGHLVKTGGAALTLSGSNTYTGTTFIRGGVLVAGSTVGANANAAAAVNRSALVMFDNPAAGGTLATSGTLAAREQVAAGAAGHLASTAGAGTLTVTATDRTQAAGGAVFVGAGGTYSLSGNISFVNNLAAAGGAIHFDGAGALNLGGGDVLFASNTATSTTAGGGAISSSMLTLGGSAGTLAFTGNTAGIGGAIYAGSRINVTATTAGNLAITGNRATAGNRAGQGGAFYAGGGITLNNSVTGTLVISSNTGAGHGGAFFVQNGGITVGGSYGGILISSNRTTVDYGGAFLTMSGAIVLDSQVAGALVISDNTGDYGGAFFALGDGITLGGSYGAIAITSNTAGAGDGAGGAFFTGNQINVTATTAGDLAITGNRANTQGGAFYAATGITLNNSVTGTLAISNNTAGSRGGAFYAGGGAITLGGRYGGILFASNRASGAGGALYSAGAVTLSATAAGALA